MDSNLDDDICILTHEKADCIPRKDQQTPFSSSSGEASVASHFALVTAYEDIKKRLKDTEKENNYLKKRLRLLEEKLCGKHAEEASTVGHEQEHRGWVGGKQVNKAYSAFREVCIERDKLKNKLNLLEKEKLESTKSLNEQLQAKEVELLQVKSELETHQVMQSLSKTPSDWEIEKLNRELKIRSVEQELKLLQEEFRNLQAELQRTKDSSLEKQLSSRHCLQEHETASESSVRQAYWELKKEMSNLHVVTEVQAEVLRKLKGTIAATKKASQSAPVQCEDDLARNCSGLHLTATGNKVPFAHEHKFEHSRISISGPPPHSYKNTLYEKTLLTSHAGERPIPVGGTDCDNVDFFPKSSLEENSWVMPSPPKPSETLFWEPKNNSTANNLSQFYNPNYPFKS
ncbi:5-azacytidine-induced protein 2 [Pelobates fuscus]|uniref:5-azacytidine-induced protein 2 n=1 Tax=Pelobates fuscus TaxID=191477 RepID=UPI002FE4BDFE